MAQEYAGYLMFNTKLDSGGFNKGAKKIGGMGGKLTDQLAKYAKRGAIAMGTAITAAMVSGVKYNAQMEQYYQSFKTMLGSTKEATKHMQMLKKFAAETPFEMTDLANASQTLLAFGENVNLIEGDLKMLGDISLGNKEKFSALALVFGQVKSQGRLMGQDLLQMINAGFNPLTIISKKTGKSMAQLKDEMAKGQITFDMVADAMKTATSAGGQFNDAMKTQSKTVIGLWSTLKDNVHAKLGEAMESVSNIIKSSLLPNAIKFVEKFNVKETVAGVRTLIDVLKIVSPLIAGLYVAPRVTSGAGALAGLWSRGLLEAKKYKIEMAAIARLSLKGTKAEISGVGVVVGLLTQKLTLAEAKTLALGRAQAVVAGINPYVAIVVGVLAFVTAVELAKKTMQAHALESDKDYSAVLKLAKANEEAEKAYNSQRKAAANDMVQKGAEVENAINLKRELDGIVDASGRVKKGYEGRAAAIVSILQSQGAEISMQNGVIKNYGELSQAIDNYLVKKRAQIVLDAYEESYKTAQRNIRKSTEAYTKASRELDKHTKSQAEINRMSARQVSEYEEKQAKLIKAKNKAAAQVNKYNKDITRYEQALAEFEKGNYSKINAVLDGHAQAMADINKKNKKQLRKQRQDTAAELKALNRLYKKTGSDNVKAAAEAKQKELAAIDSKLGEQTARVKGNRGKMKAATKDMMGGVQEGIKESDISIDDQLNKLSESPKNYAGGIKAAMNSLVSAANNAAGGANLKGAFAPRLSQLSSSPHGWRGTIASAMSSLMNAARSSAGSVSFYGVGYNAGTGIKSGILAAKAQVIAAGIAIANAVVDNMKKAIESRSPSRKTARLVGAPITQGVGVGMMRESKALYKKARQVANNTVAAMKVDPVTIGLGVKKQISIPSAAKGTTLPVQARTSIMMQSKERGLLDKLIDKIEQINARPITQEINFHERVYTPADARDRLAELARLGLEVDA